MRGVLPLAAWELHGALRSRWVLATGGMFAAACLAAAVFGLQSLRNLGLGGAGAAIDGLVNVGVLLPPLLALLLGSAALAGARERGLLPLFAAQPVSRASLALGGFAGVVATVMLTVAVGYGLAVVVAGGAATSGDLPAFARLLVATFAVVAAAAAIGIAISAVSSNRLQATAAAVSVWFVLAFGLDVVVATAAPALALGPRGLFATLLLNPLELGRLLALLSAGSDGAALGTFGLWLVGRFGGASIVVLATGLAVWTGVPLFVAGAALRGRDL